MAEKDSVDSASKLSQHLVYFCTYLYWLDKVTLEGMHFGLIKIVIVLLFTESLNVRGKRLVVTNKKSHIVRLTILKQSLQKL